MNNLMVTAWKVRRFRHFRYVLSAIWRVLEESVEVTEQQTG